MRSSNDVAWERILEHSRLKVESAIEDQGYFDISAEQIRKIGKREPRLACKHDFRIQVPKPLKERSLSVLAIKNGHYRIAPTDPYFKLDISRIHAQSAPTYRIPEELEFLDASSLSSESKALDAALVSGILHDAFDESDDLSLVIRGREYSREFSFSLSSALHRGRNSIPYDVNGVQIEVDGGYEGRRGLHLVEAKIYSEQKSMNLRQILYPYLHYEKAPTNKRVLPYVMFFDPATSWYSFYRFDPADLLGSKVWEPAEQRDYQLVRTESSRSLEEIGKTQVSSNIVDTARPFPQADSFPKIASIFNSLGTYGEVHKDDLFGEFDITNRQYDYYGNALRWMRLVEKDGPRYRLTQLGIEINGLSDREQMFRMAKIIYSNDVFNAWLVGSRDEAKTRLSRYLKSDSTIERRLKTVRSWTQFFRDHVFSSESKLPYGMKT